jgi:hypothetical protein
MTTPSHVSAVPSRLPMDSVAPASHTLAQRSRIGHTLEHRPRQICKPYARGSPLDA